MTIDDKIKGEKLQNTILTEKLQKSKEISALSSDKTDEYEYLTGE